MAMKEEHLGHPAMLSKLTAAGLLEKKAMRKGYCSVR
jgi:hypothetical protein